MEEKKAETRAGTGRKTTKQGGRKTETGKGMGRNRTTGGGRKVEASKEIGSKRATGRGRGGGVRDLRRNWQQENNWRNLIAQKWTEREELE